MMQYAAEIPERLLVVSGLQGKIAFNHFSEPQQLPYAAYDFQYSSDGADDMHSLLTCDVSIELYQKSRDFQLEKSIFKTFEDVTVSTYTEYIDDEKMYLTEFTFSFIEKG